MTQKEVSQLIASIGLPYAYDHFDAPQQLPYICFLYPSSENFAADGIVYQKVVQLSIELYTKQKEPALEKTVEDVLNAAELFYDSSESYIESEKMHMSVWTTSVLITG